MNLFYRFKRILQGIVGICSLIRCSATVSLTQESNQFATEPQQPQRPQLQFPFNLWFSQFLPLAKILAIGEHVQINMFIKCFSYSNPKESFKHWSICSFATTMQFHYNKASKFRSESCSYFMFSLVATNTWYQVEVGSDVLVHLAVFYQCQPRLRTSQSLWVLNRIVKSVYFQNRPYLSISTNSVKSVYEYFQEGF